MIVSAKITSKGQITIPKKIRAFLKVEKGSVVIFQAEHGKVYLKNTATLKNFRGILKGSRQPDDFKKIRAYVKEEMARKRIENA